MFGERGFVLVAISDLMLNVIMKLIIEFPMYILSGYHGISNLDETLDDNITHLIGKYFYDRNITFSILKIEHVQGVPNINDALVRYEVLIGLEETAFDPDWIFTELEQEGFERGLTIKSESGEILYADRHTADIQYRRKYYGKGR